MDCLMHGRMSAGKADISVVTRVIVYLEQESKAFRFEPRSFPAWNKGCYRLLYFWSHCVIKIMPLPR